MTYMERQCSDKPGYHGFLPHRALEYTPGDYEALAQNLSQVRTDYLDTRRFDPVADIQAQLMDDAIAVLRAYAEQTRWRPWRWIMTYLRRWYL